MRDNLGAAEATDLFTKDSLFDGRLICYQHRSGYRFSVDALLLAHFCRIQPGGRVLDIGCGSGIVGLILLFLHKEIVVTGLEIQQSLIKLARKNVEENFLSDRMEILAGDACHPGEILAPESYDLVVCNPPYRPAGSGRLNQDGEAAIARHELKATLADMVSAASFAVKNKHPVCFVYPADGLAHIVATLENTRLTVKRVQPVYSSRDSAMASLVLIEAIKNGGTGTAICSPFYIYAGEKRVYSQGMQKLYEGDVAALARPATRNRNME